MLLVDHYRRQTLGTRLNSFEFRARRPLFDGNDLGLHSSGPELWTSGPDGQPAMTARIT
jgi:hydroxyacyl-ACP dehydratase HTD2-like protein with hotdog domain